MSGFFLKELSVPNIFWHNMASQSIEFFDRTDFHISWNFLFLGIEIQVKT